MGKLAEHIKNHANTISLHIVAPLFLGYINKTDSFTNFADETELCECIWVVLLLGHVYFNYEP